MLNNLKEYLSSVLSESISFSPDRNVSDRLPLTISWRYSIYSANIFGCRTCFAIDRADTTPFGYEKESAVISRIAGYPVVIVVADLSPVNVHRMIQKRIDFIVPGKRMFMPSLLIDLGGRYPARKASDTIIPPLAQLIILFHVQKENLNGKDANRISEMFGMTYLTASRALKWIGEKISPLKAIGRSLVLDLPDGGELIQAAKSYLRTPVVKRIITDEPLDGIWGVLAGESALEESSMLVATGECKAIAKDAQINVCPDGRGLNVVEVWMYDPAILAEDGICDKISLVLSLTENTDERVQKEVENIKSEIGW